MTEGIFDATGYEVMEQVPHEIQEVLLPIDGNIVSVGEGSDFRVEGLILFKEGEVPADVDGEGGGHGDTREAAKRGGPGLVQ